MRMPVCTLLVGHGEAACGVHLPVVQTIWGIGFSTPKSEANEKIFPISVGSGATHSEMSR